MFSGGIKREYLIKIINSNVFFFLLIILFFPINNLDTLSKYFVFWCSLRRRWLRVQKKIDL